MDMKPKAKRKRREERKPETKDFAQGKGGQ